MMEINKKNYVIENELVRKERVIALLSDLHYTPNMSQDILNSIILDLSAVNPDIICFAGDLINDAKEFGGIRYLIAWLETLSKIAPVCLVKGNHDYLTFDRQAKKWHYYDSNELFAFIADIENVFILEKDKPLFEDEELTISGFDLGKFTEKYYKEHHESNAAFKLYVKPELTNIQGNLDPERLNILLTHSPRNYFDNLDLKYNILMFGHMHNGAVPSKMLDKIKTNRGIISPHGEILPRYAHGIVEISENKTGIIASPITTIANKSNHKLVRTLYKPGIQYLNIRKK